MNPLTTNATSWDRLLAAAEGLLRARGHKMVTDAEWRALRDATADCRRAGRTYTAEPIAPQCACPNCGEDDADQLVWTDDEQVECRRCSTVYQPQGGPPHE
jgi:hypothetical protein